MFNSLSATEVYTCIHPEGRNISINSAVKEITYCSRLALLIAGYDYPTACRPIHTWGKPTLQCAYYRIA